MKRNEDDAKNAARYLWLRDERNSLPYGCDSLFAGDALDAAIDGAMKEPKL
jgi:hypothetical protein